MTQLSGTMQLSVGTATVAVASIGGELASSLIQYGYNPADFNYLRWPVGASAWGEGALLLIGPDVETIGAQLENGPAKLTLISEVGTTEIEDLRLGPPQPVLVPNRGTARSLYRVPVYDARWEARTKPGAFNYNLTSGDDDSLDRGADEALSQLLAGAGLPVSIVGQSADWMPYDVRSRASAAVAWADRILRETGRVYVYGIDGSGTVEFDDQRRSLDIMDGLNAYLMTGGVRYASTLLTGHYVDVAPDAAWVNHRVPSSVSVIFRNTPSGVPEIVSASYSATDAGFSSASGEPVYLHDNAPTDEAETQGRADALAEAFYRRFKAGGVIARLSGWHAPQMGGSCRVVTWRLFNGLPITDIDSDPFADAAAAPVPRIAVTAGGGLRSHARPDGGIDVVGDVSRELWVRITAAEQVSYGQWEYEWVEVEPGSAAGVYDDAVGGKTSESDGLARNGVEAPNQNPGVLGNGIDTANIPAGFAPVPIGVGAVVKIEGPFGDPTPYWLMAVSTHVDGSCQQAVSV